MRVRVLLGVAAVVGTVVCGVIACENAVGSDACVSIEHARCKWIVQCFADAAGGNYGLPTPRSGQTTTSSPVDDCMRFYDDACLHGMVTNVAPTSDEVTTCVNTINTATDCTIVTNPETTDACAFLAFDAGTDADAD
jgi:hypothetical protein